MFNKPLRSRKKDLFDIDGRHSNIKMVKGSRKDLENIWNYLRKEKFRNFGDWEGPDDPRCVVYHPFLHI
jgi:hypothetical protein